MWFYSTVIIRGATTTISDGSSFWNKKEKEIKKKTSSNLGSIPSIPRPSKLVVVLIINTRCEQDRRKMALICTRPSERALGHDKWLCATIKEKKREEKRRRDRGPGLRPRQVPRPPLCKEQNDPKKNVNQENLLAAAAAAAELETRLFIIIYISFFFCFQRQSDLFFLLLLLFSLFTTKSPII